MGLILQRQRRAIESVCPDKKLNLCASEKFRFSLLGEGELFILGVSAGKGTCSDIFGMNVLVLGKSKPAEDMKNLLDEGKMCDYVVLLDDPRVEEYFLPSEADGRTVLGCVELLQVSDQGLRMVYLARTGKRALYTII